MGSIDPLQQLALAIEKGNVGSTSNLLRTNPHLASGRIGPAELSILEYAIYHGPVPLFAHLIKIDKSVNPTVETLLHAINFGNEEIVLTLLAEMECRGIVPNGEASKNSRTFPPYMTPLMLACFKNNFSLVKMLCVRGHGFTAPHRANCACRLCHKSRASGETMHDREKRLATLRCLCSEVYLFQDHIEDPFLEAMMLSRELEKCQEVESDILEKYKDLRVSLGKVPTTLLAECTTVAQVRTILENPVGSSRECTGPFPRLRLALDMHCKEILVDRRCQRIVKDQWLGEWVDWNLATPLTKISRLFGHTLIFPILSLIFIFSFNRKCLSCNIPFARFLSAASAHVLFLLCIVLNMQIEEPRDVRGPAEKLWKQLLIFYVWLYVAGYLAVTTTDIWRLGFRRYLDVWWHWYDLFVGAMYFLSFQAYFIAWLSVSHEGFHKLHRAHWTPLDPTLLFEVFFASASISSVWRMFYFLQLNRKLGPTIISIGRCIKDILHYLLVMAIVMLSFSIGLNYLYEHYKYNSVTRKGWVIPQPFHFTSIVSSIRYLYWALYGYLPPENLDVIVGQSGPENSETMHTVTASSCEILVAIYNVCIIVVILNLMVSMMTGTAAKIMENEDSEWKLICAYVKAEFFEDSRSVPAPFNLLQLCYSGLVCLTRFLLGCKQREKILSVWDPFYNDVQYENKDYVAYCTLILLLKRKILAKRALNLPGDFLRMRNEL